MYSKIRPWTDINPHGQFLSQFHSIFSKQPGRPTDWTVGGPRQPMVHGWFPQESALFNMKNEEKVVGHNRYRKVNNLMHITQ